MNTGPLIVSKFKIYKDRYDFLMRRYKPGTILDIGNVGGRYGAGISSSFHMKFKKSVSFDSIVFGLDLFDPPEKERHLYEKQIKHNLEYGLPLKDNLFSTVYAGQIIEHMKNPYFIISEIYRVLIPEGVLVFDVPNIYSLSRIIKFFICKEENLGDPTHISFLTPASIQKMMESIGFNIQEMATDWKERWEWLPKVIRRGLGAHLLVAGKK